MDTGFLGRQEDRYCAPREKKKTETMIQGKMIEIVFQDRRMGKMITGRVT